MGQAVPKEPTHALTLPGGELDNQKTRAAMALFAGGGPVLNPPTKEGAEKKLARIGIDRVIEMYCSGQLEHEIAYGIGVTFFQFREWYHEQTDAAKRLKVKHAQAAALVARAQVLLSYHADGDATTIGLAKSQANQFIDLAKRLHPEAWGRDKPAADASVGDTFVLNFGALTSNINNGQIASHINVVRGGEVEEKRAEDVAMAPLQKMLGSWGQEIAEERRPTRLTPPVEMRRPSPNPPPELRKIMRERDFTVADPE